MINKFHTIHYCLQLTDILSYDIFLYASGLDVCISYLIGLFNVHLTVQLHSSDTRLLCALRSDSSDFPTY